MRISELLEKIDDVFDGEEKADVFLFFSVDMVNATHFKTVNENGWVTVFKDFYDIVGAQVKKAYINSEVWKYAGDEILFHIKAGNLENILHAPSRLYDAMVTAQRLFHEKHTCAAHSLYMKSALWVAAVSDGEALSSARRTQNICTRLSGRTDFVGVDIDEGFRMSKNAAQGKLVLDPKIAYILNKHEKSELVKIVGTDYLKGCWGGRAYPVIWYTDRWDSPDLFLYDEHNTNEFVKSYLQNGAKEIGHIVKIFRDLGFLDVRIRQIEEIIGTGRISISKRSDAANPVSLRNVTISYDAANNRAFIVKDGENGGSERKFVYVQK